MYADQILDHASSPRNKVLDVNSLSGYLTGVGKNPSCGDKANYYIKIENDKVIDLKWVGEGCAVSQAGMSMLSEYLIGKNISEMKTIFPGTIYKLLNINITASRAPCALLCYNATEDFLKKYATN